MRKKGMLTTKEFAQQVNAAYTTVMGWLKDGRIPGAIFDDSIPRGGIWYIPRVAVEKFKQESRTRGRPRKVKADKVSSRK
jgi:predicted site-specific integrase-resolvase